MEEYEQAPQMQYPMDGSNKADLLDKINPDKVVEEMKNKLMGREFNEKTRTWIANENLKRNAVSELCANDMANLILSVSNQNVSISKLSDKEIRLRAYSVMKTAIKMILANWKSYDISNSAQINFVSDIIFSLSFITMKQADAEGIRKMIVGTRSEMHHESSYSEPKKSVFGRGR